MCIELKIKSKHLALEPQIIKHEERKLKKQIRSNKGDLQELLRKYESLVNHRKYIVRNESRATQLARAYISGRQYTSIERKRHDNSSFLMYIVPRIHAMVTRYGTGEQRKITKEDIIEWSKL
jgi:hypothetical protein